MSEANCIAGGKLFIFQISVFRFYKCVKDYFTISNFRLSSKYLPLLRELSSSPVFTIRKLVARSFLSFIPNSMMENSLKENLQQLQSERNNNALHTTSLTIKHKLNISSSTLTTSFLGYVQSTLVEIIQKREFDNITKSNIASAILQCHELLETNESSVLLYKFVKLALQDLRNCAQNTQIGRALFQKIVAKAVAVLLQGKLAILFYLEIVGYYFVVFISWNLQKPSRQLHVQS